MPGAQISEPLGASEFGTRREHGSAVGRRPPGSNHVSFIDCQHCEAASLCHLRKGPRQGRDEGFWVCVQDWLIP